MNFRSIVKHSEVIGAHKCTKVVIPLESRLIKYVETFCKWSFSIEIFSTRSVLIYSVEQSMLSSDSIYFIAKIHLNF